MDKVNGNDVRLYAYNTDGYYLFACATEVTLIEETELLSNTSPSSGSFRTYRPRISNWKLSLRGLLFLQNQIETMWMALDLFQASARDNGLYAKLVFSDEAGFQKTITGHVFIPSKSITASAGTLAKWSTEFQGSGAYTLS